MTIIIRQATIEDYKGIEALIHAAFAEKAAQFLTTDLEKRLKDNRMYSIVAVDKSIIIGHALISSLDTPRVGFGSLAVAPSHRQKGIASALTTARIRQLEKLRFQGTANSDAATNHPYSQQSLLRAGFYPVRILLARLPYNGIELETTVGFVRLFQPPTEKTGLYLPEQYREIASTVLSPFAHLGYKDSTCQDISNRIQEISDKELSKQNSLIVVRLYEKTAPAEITYLQEKGFIIAGFYPVTIQDNTVLSAVVHMHKVPSTLLDKTKIHVIPEVEPLFDFVWRQYEA